MPVPFYQELQAPPPLDALVHCFWFLRGQMPGDAQAVVPDARMEIVLHLAEPFAQVTDDGRARRQAPVLVAGQLTAPIHLAPTGPADVVGIRFRSAGARCLLRQPAAELTGLVRPLAELDRSLEARLLSALPRGGAGSRPSDQAMVIALAGALLGAVRRAPLPLVREAIQALALRGPVRVRELAPRLGITPRTLERRMLDEVGLGPRTLHRVLRFRRILRSLEQTPRGRWARSAVQSGYFDQAHMIREFRQFAGAAPGDYFATEAPLSRALSGP
jgi:AraC-like DNA-binding protein